MKGKLVRSLSVEEVLNSKEFNAWMPGDRVHLNKTIVRYPAFVIATSLCAGLAVSFYYIHHLNFIGFMIVSVASICLTIATLIYFFGCRIERVIRFTREEIEVWEGHNFLFGSRWDAIQFVSRVGKNGFVLKGDSSDVTIWLPNGISSSNEYDTFLKQVLIGMSGEDFSVAMVAYLEPTELEEGKTYAYGGQDLLKRRLYQAYLLLAVAVLLGFLDLIKREWMGLFSSISLGLLGLLIASQMRDRLRRTQHVWISVVEGHLVIRQGESTSTFPKYVLERSLSPESKAIPFSKYELFGDSKGSVRVDRRFLRQQNIS